MLRSQPSEQSDMFNFDDNATKNETLSLNKLKVHRTVGGNVSVLSTVPMKTQVKPMLSNDGQLQMNRVELRNSPDKRSYEKMKANLRSFREELNEKALSGVVPTEMCIVTLPERNKSRIDNHKVVANHNPQYTVSVMNPSPQSVVLLQHRALAFPKGDDPPKLLNLNQPSWFTTPVRQDSMVVVPTSDHTSVQHHAVVNYEKIEDSESSTIKKPITAPLEECTSISKSNPAIYGPAKQVELDSGNGSDEENEASSTTKATLVTINQGDEEGDSDNSCAVLQAGSTSSSDNEDESQSNEENIQSASDASCSSSDSELSEAEIAGEWDVADKENGQLARNSVKRGVEEKRVRGIHHESVIRAAAVATATVSTAVGPPVTPTVSQNTTVSSCRSGERCISPWKMQPTALARRSKATSPAGDASLGKEHLVPDSIRPTPGEQKGDKKVHEQDGHIEGRGAIDSEIIKSFINRTSSDEASTQRLSKTSWETTKSVISADVRKEGTKQKKFTPADESLNEHQQEQASSGERDVVRRMKKSGVTRTSKAYCGTSHPALIPSLFPNVPPVLKFVEDGQKLESLPWDFRRLLRWRASMLTPAVVKQVLMRSGFRVSKLTSSSEDLETVESSDWIFYFGKHMRPQVFRGIREYQKVNHLPCSFQLGRKDRLWKNLVHMQTQCGKENFNFMPQTFCLPGDLDALKRVWDEEGNGQRWILKPPASARGIGVRLITKWAQVPKKRGAIVQKYLARPYLINDSKFDLRIYVYISSINPLRVYIHEDGLVRFASQKYTNSVRCLGNRFIHLTNYSINRLNSEYVSNSNDLLAKGHKWSLRALWAYFRSQGISPTPVWSSIKDVVVKTAISTEAAFNTAINSYCTQSCSVHEVFGFDIFLDEDLQPWLLEVNVSPSMHSDSPLDAKIKGNMVKDMMNIAGLRLPESSDITSQVVVPTSIPKVSSSVKSTDLNIGTEPTPDPMGISITPVQTPNQSNILSDEPIGGNSPLCSFGDVELSSLRCLKKPRIPTHEWIIDSRVHMSHLSQDEREKRRYYVMRASQYELPKLHCGHSANSSLTSGRHDRTSSLRANRQTAMRKNQGEPVKCTTGAHYIGDVDESTRTSSPSSDLDSDNMSTRASSPCIVGGNRLAMEECANNSSRRGARSMGIGPSSPDLRSHRVQTGKDAFIPRPPAVPREKPIQRTVTRATPNPPIRTRKMRSSASCKSSESLSKFQHTLPRVRLVSATADILHTLTPSDCRILISMVDELDRAGGFECVFPPTSAGLAVRYLSYFEAPRYANLLCIAYLQKYGQDSEKGEKGIEMLRSSCEKQVHLLSAAYGDSIAQEHMWDVKLKPRSMTSKESVKSSSTPSPPTRRPHSSSKRSTN